MAKLERLALLGVLLESSGAVSRTRLMKLLFLLRQDAGVEAFDFFPYQYGPYSWLAQRALDSLYADGSVVGTKPSIGRQANATSDYAEASAHLRNGVRRIVDLLSGRSDDDVLSLVYERFPEFTVNSNLGPRRSRAKATDVLFSVGYEGITIDRFLNTLIQAGVQRLLDVRRNPISRRFGFSKTRLAAYCEKVEIEYIHIPELGIASEFRSSLSDEESYRRLFDFYEAKLLPQQSSALIRAQVLAKEKASALLCFEADPRLCHRSRLSNHLERATGLPVVHLAHS